MARPGQFSRRRLRRRLLRHFAPLLALSATLVVILEQTVAGGAVQRLSIATGYVALALLALTLAVGPVRALTRRRLPLSIDFRRDAGICTAILGLVHVVLGLQVHFGGRIASYFLESEAAGGPGAIRLDRGGVANWTGLAATILLVLLLALSNDRAIRGLGARRWKRLQRLAYVLLGLVALHTLLYQVLEERIAWLIMAGAALSGAAIALQLAGLLRRRVADAAPARA
jgi:methionine sulfoxide reductase heme-binding subunit